MVLIKGIRVRGESEKVVTDDVDPAALLVVVVMVEVEERGMDGLDLRE